MSELFGPVLIRKQYPTNLACACALEWSPSALPAVLKGRGTPAQQARLADHLGVPVSELFTNDPRPLLKRLLAQHGETTTREIAAEAEIRRAHDFTK